MGKRLTFTPLAGAAPGTLLSLLTESHQDLTDTYAERWSGEAENWAAFDTDAFQRPDSAGKCVFVTRLGADIIGFGSYDPRGLPETGKVGHNCILPAHRQKGYGSRQLEEIVRRLKTLGARKVMATTSEHPFYLPAREMYMSMGFTETGRSEGGPDPDFRLVHYELSLDDPRPEPVLNDAPEDEEWGKD
ncbi:MAG: GNAT family N-acetyltransferase [candidate division WOR-3 bacterium]|nr:MAG: GNAT family N-acetyltransferase [candidate division WOR-3 bacterium]